MQRLQPLSQLVITTDQTRQNLVLQLKEMLAIARKNANQSKRPRERREWLKIATYIAKSTNIVLRDLDLDLLKEKMNEIETRDREWREEQERKRTAPSPTSFHYPSNPDHSRIRTKGREGGTARKAQKNIQEIR